MIGPYRTRNDAVTAQTSVTEAEATNKDVRSYCILPPIHLPPPHSLTPPIDIIICKSIKRRKSK